MNYQDIIPQLELVAFAHAMNSRAKSLNINGRIDVTELRDRILASGGCCEWCGASVVNASFEVDHVVSLSNGGSNSPQNLVVACPSCNRKKGRKHPARFAQEISVEVGLQTRFVKLVLQRYDMPASTQPSLFDDTY